MGQAYREQQQGVLVGCGFGGCGVDGKKRKEDTDVGEVGGKEEA